MLTTDPFRDKVLKSLRAEGVQIRRIIRVYPAGEFGDPIEVLFVGYNGAAGTVYVDANAHILLGPIAGFG